MAIKTLTFTIGASNDASTEIKNKLSEHDFPAQVSFTNLVHHAISFPEFGLELLASTDAKNSIQIVDVKSIALMKQIASTVHQVALLHGHKEMVKAELNVLVKDASAANVVTAKPKKEPKKEIISLDKDMAGG